MADPLAQQPPSTLLPKVIKKYSDPVWQQFPDTVVGPLSQIDLDRARRGVSPLSKSDTALAAGAANTLQEQIKQPSPSWLSSWVQDAQSILGNIPHMPGQLLNEIGQLPQAPAQLAQGVADLSPKEIFSAPGLRMLPGAYLAQHGLEGFLQHPLYATLDVAPYIHAGAEALIPDAVAEAAKAKIGGVFDKFGLGPVSQESSRLFNQGNRVLGESLINYTQKTAKLTEGLAPEEIANITNALKTGLPEDYAALPKAHQEIFNQAKGMANELQQQGLATGHLGEHEGEVYPYAQAQRLDKLKAKYDAAIADGEPKAIDAALSDYQEAVKNTPPQRFQNLINQQVEDQVKYAALDANPGISQEGWDGIEKRLNARFYDLVPGLDQTALEGIGKEAAATWQDLRDSGHNPTFIHSVSPEDVGRLSMPRVMPQAEPSLASTKAQTWNMAPGVSNFAVGLNAQALDFLQHETTTAVINQFKDTFGKTKAELVDQYLPIAEGMPANPQVSIGQRVQQLIARDYARWDPGAAFPMGKGEVRPLSTASDYFGDGQEYYLPKPVEKVMRTIYPVDKTGLGRLWDQAMGVFRIGILPLSPRWHINNALGAAVMMAGRTGPSIVSDLGDALQMVRDGTMPKELSQGMVSVPKEIRQYDFTVGDQLGGLLKNEWMKKAAQGGANVIQKSYEFQQFIDNMYRSASYLYGKRTGLAKGLTEEEAHVAGIKLGNKVLQDWDAMTPVERQVIRSIFPFYGWVKHIGKYVMTYPWDHPYRTAFVANFAANEIQDRATGVPDEFRNYLFFGSPDKFGNQTGIPTHGINPFADVGNYFTLAGFVSQLNPVASGLLTAMGFNPRTGAGSLYPELVVNPETGKLQAATKNPFLSIAEGLVPQAQGITSLLGLDDQSLRALKLNNPSAYRSRILSSFGITLPTRDLNPHYEAAKMALAQNQVLQQRISSALKTGDYGPLARYPQMAPIVDRLKQLDKSGALDAYKIPQAGTKQYNVQDVLASIRGG